MDFTVNGVKALLVAFLEHKTWHEVNDLVIREDHPLFETVKFLYKNNVDEISVNLVDGRTATFSITMAYGFYTFV